VEVVQHATFRAAAHEAAQGRLASRHPGTEQRAMKRAEPLAGECAGAVATVPALLVQTDELREDSIDVVRRSLDELDRRRLF
jgi:hypothetical protein